MKKIDLTVLKETKYIALFSLILSMLMQSVFLIIGRWDYTVLLGNILGFSAAVGNFLLMGITVQNALVKSENDAKNLIKFSQTMRMLLLFGAAILGHLIPVFSLIAVVIPYIFPRIAILFRPLFIKE